MTEESIDFWRRANILQADLDKLRKDLVRAKERIELLEEVYKAADAMETFLTLTVAISVATDKDRQVNPTWYLQLKEYVRDFNLAKDRFLCKNSQEKHSL